MHNKLFIALTLITLAASLPLAAQPVATRNATVELIAEIASIQPGQPFKVGLHLVMDKDWHTYWKNPGDAGMASSIRWELPEGFSAGDIEWPTPHVFGEAPEISYGYDGDLLLPITITPPATIRPGTKVTLRAHAGWLICNDICISDKAELTLVLPVKKGDKKESSWATLFATARAHTPQNLLTVQVTASNRENGYLMHVTSTDAISSPLDLYFFAGEEEVIDHSAEQNVTQDGGSTTLLLRRSSYAQQPATRLHGVLIVSQHNGLKKIAYNIDIPVEGLQQSN
jgi:DsbC/DsbD-like thiol-disulfide interchange protein